MEGIAIVVGDGVVRERELLLPVASTNFPLAKPL